MKDRAYVINLDKCDDIGIHVVVCFVKNDLVNFIVFGVDHIPEEIKKFTSNKNIKANIFRIQAYDSIIDGYFCI